MGGVNHLNDSHGRSRDHFPYISIEGTSARTRSFSFEEVMLRRKQKNVVAELTEESDQSTQVAEISNSIEVSQPEKVLEDLVRSDHRKESTKEESLSNKKERSKRNHETEHGAETDVEVSHAMYSTKDKHLKNVKEDHYRRTNEQFEDAYGKEFHKKHHKDVLVKDVDMERGRRPERDIRSLRRTEISVKVKSEIHRSELKKPDLHKPRDVEYTEKRGRWYEEPRPQIRRSRSREFDRFRERSASISPRKRERFKNRLPLVSPGAWHWANQRSPPVSPRMMKWHNRRSPPVSYRTRPMFRRRSPSLSPRARNLSNQRSPSISPRAQKRFRQRPDSKSPKPHKRSHRRSSSISPRAPKRPHRRSVSTSPKPQKRSHRRSSSISPMAHKRSHQRRDSISPRVQKRSQHVNYSHEDVDTSPPSFREKSGKEKSETNMPRTSRNGMSDRQSSGLGGYSPRKRKTVTTTKTLSSPLHSHDAKTATWDQPPADASANALSSTSKTEEFPAPIPITAISEKSQSASLSNTPSMPLDLSLESVQLTQATRPMRRLYIENLPNSASDKAVIEWLNDFLRSSIVSRVHGNSPCISCIINKEKYQAVVEFLTPEDATAALSLNEKSFSGSVLKIRRPKDFIDPVNVIAEKVPDKTVSHAVADVVNDSPHKIFIGGISKHLTSGMLMDIVRCFGTLKAYQFEVNQLGEQYAYLEYLDPGVTSNACTCLDGMKLGGQILTAVKAFHDWNLDVGHESLSSDGIPAHAKPLLANPTRVLKLTNVFNMEEFTTLPDPEVEEILEDVRIECSRFGTVKSVNVVRQVDDDPASVFEHDTIVIPGENTTDHNTSEDPVSPIAHPDAEDTPGNPSTDVSLIERASTPLSKTASDPPEVSDKELQVDDAICIEVADEDGSSVHTAAKAEELDLVYQEATEPAAVDIEKVELVQTATIPADVKMPLDSDEEEKIQEDPLAVAMNDEEERVRDPVAHAFEVGCVLVEFTREEAACVTAHCLNGRPYDGRAVEVSFVSPDVYLEQFPR